MTQHDDINAQREALLRKLRRFDAGLAPEDEAIEQALNTARLRRDPSYVAQWLVHEAREGRAAA